METVRLKLGRIITVALSLFGRTTSEVVVAASEPGVFVKDDDVDPEKCFADNVWRLMFDG